MPMNSFPHPFNNIHIVLVRPKYSGNIGSVSRAMKNYGLSSLKLIKGANPLTKASKASSVFAQDILENAQHFDDLDQAIQEASLVIGLTRRFGEKRRVLQSFDQLLPKIFQVSSSSQICLVFGPEDYGLSIEDCRKCHMLSNILSHENYGSLNLSQAVLLIGYELYKHQGIAPSKSIPKITESQRQSFLDQVLHLMDQLEFFGYDKEDNIRRFFNKLLAQSEITQEEFAILNKIFQHTKRLIYEKSGF